LIDKTKPAEAGFVFETLVRAFQQVKEASARSISEGSTNCTTRMCDAAIASLTPLKLHHAAHATHPAHIRHRWCIIFW
jgi:hypothetical protein